MRQEQRGIRAALSWQWPRVLLLAVLLLGGVSWANVTLHGKSRAHEVTRGQLAELNMLLHEESSLQWKTLADRNSPVKVARELGAIRSRERAILGALPDSDALRAEIADYHKVLDDELGKLGVGETVAALQLEQEETDPRYTALTVALRQLEDEATADADRANDIADLVLILAMAAAVIAIGVLLFRFEREHRATHRANEEMMAQQQIALDTLAEHEALVRHQASHDPLTGLPNRRTLSELLDHADGPQALLLIDLDDFKPVNDRLGHAAGDELLCGVAGRLLAAVRAEDTVVRLGGDEFAVVVGSGNAEVAVRVAERIVAQVGEPFAVAGAQVCVGASVGVATSAVRIDGNDLMRQADLAMYKVKQDAKGGYAVFTADVLATA